MHNTDPSLATTSRQANSTTAATTATSAASRLLEPIKRTASRMRQQSSSTDSIAQTSSSPPLSPPKKHTKSPLAKLAKLGEICATALSPVLTKVKTPSFGIRKLPDLTSEEGNTDVTLRSSAHSAALDATPPASELSEDDNSSTAWVTPQHHKRSIVDKLEKAVELDLSEDVDEKPKSPAVPFLWQPKYIDRFVAHNIVFDCITATPAMRSLLENCGIKEIISPSTGVRVWGKISEDGKYKPLFESQDSFQEFQNAIPLAEARLLGDPNSEYNQSARMLVRL